MTREEHIKNMKDVRHLNTDYLPLQVCLKMIAEALIFCYRGGRRMTREEAISGLKEIRDWTGLPYCIEEPLGKEGIAVITTKVIDMAIKALEQEGYYKDLAQSYERTIIKLTEAIKVLDQEPILDKIRAEESNKWIPLKTRPMTDEETEHYFEYMDTRIDDTYTILDCPLPDDGQEVLVSWCGMVCEDIFGRDGEGCYFEGVDIDDVDAWMPLPEPYRAESEGK